MIAGTPLMYGFTRAMAASLLSEYRLRRRDRAEVDVTEAESKIVPFGIGKDLVEHASDERFGNIWFDNCNAVCPRTGWLGRVLAQIFYVLPQQHSLSSL